MFLFVCGLFVLCHLFAFSKKISWENALRTTKNIPSRLNKSQKAYLFYQQNNFTEAEKIWWSWLSGNYQYLFNYWTLLAQNSFLSGQVHDKNQLQQAEHYLSWAADIVQNKEIEHNLAVVRKLLEETWTWSDAQQQQDQQQSSSWDQSQSQHWTWWSQQNGEAWASPALAPELIQQIEQYQQQLAQEQEQNQQFFWKKSVWNSEWFGFLDQFFWSTPQLQQQIDSWWEQDW